MVAGSGLCRGVGVAILDRLCRGPVEQFDVEHSTFQLKPSATPATSSTRTPDTRTPDTRTPDTRAIGCAGGAAVE